MNDDGYQSGFGNTFSTEALPGALPVGRNSPQRCPYGLYAEQLSGTAFTAPRVDNRRSWLYRIRPSAMHRPFERFDAGRWTGRFADISELPATPNQLRWNPLPMPAAPTDFIEGLVMMAGQGDPHAQNGATVHLYAANRSMTRRVFYDADGELLIVPQQGRQRFVTELGVIEAEPQEIVVIPRGVRFRVELVDDATGGGVRGHDDATSGGIRGHDDDTSGGIRGYICENYGAPFRLPDLGPIGSNGLAHPRDFLTPQAAYEDIDAPYELIAKFMGQLWRAEMDHSPLDVVAWHGNHAPYKYDLRRFSPIGSISHDHPDPSIFLVLHSASATPGVSDIDFVIFPPRILAMRDTFRPPWFHRNVASEFMGLVHGAYDAKADGFSPGGASLHNCMSGHGPDAGTFEKASRADLSRPDIITDTMAFMFETRCVWRPTRQAMESAELQDDYFRCWQGLQKHFDPDKR